MNERTCPKDFPCAAYGVTRCLPLRAHVSVALLTHPSLTALVSRAAVSNSHTLGSLKPQTCVPPHPGGQKSEIRVWVCLAPSEGAWGESVPSLFQLLVAAGITWLVAPSLSAMLSHHLFFYISVLMHSVSLF